MRINGIIAIALLMTALLPQALAVGCGYNWLGGDTIGSDTSTPVGVDRPWLEKPDNQSKDAESTNSTEGESLVDEDNNNTSEVSAPETEVDLSGQWQIQLLSSLQTCSVNLTLYPAGTVVFGSGFLNCNNNTQPVTARGSVQPEKVSLDIIRALDGETYREDILYRLKLTLLNDTLSGSYEELGTDGNAGVVLSSGSATGRRSV